MSLGELKEVRLPPIANTNNEYTHILFLICSNTDFKGKCIFIFTCPVIYRSAPCAVFDVRLYLWRHFFLLESKMDNFRYRRFVFHSEFLSEYHEEVYLAIIFRLYLSFL